MNAFLSFKPLFFWKTAACPSKSVSGKKEFCNLDFRDRVKKIVKGWQENYGRQSLEMVIDTLAETRETTELLLKLADEFSSRFQEAKKERNLVDFRRPGAFCPGGVMGNQGWKTGSFCGCLRSGEPV